MSRGIIPYLQYKGVPVKISFTIESKQYEKLLSASEKLNKSKDEIFSDLIEYSSKNLTIESEQLKEYKNVSMTIPVPHAKHIAAIREETKLSEKEILERYLGFALEHLDEVYNK